MTKKLRYISVTTKTGDKGRTPLLLGGRTGKDDPRIEACGSLDELSSYLGISKSLIKQKGQRELISSIQRDLFIVGAEIATRRSFTKSLKKRIGKDNVTYLQDRIGELECTARLKGSCFYLPGGNLLSATLDVSRTIARRAERKIVALKRKGIIKNSHILVYMNRLSDLLYLMARSYEKAPQSL